MNRKQAAKPGHKPDVQLDWEVCESDAGWQSALRGAPPAAAPPRTRQWSRLLPFVVAACVLAAVAGVLAYRAQLGVAQVERELHTALEEEALHADFQPAADNATYTGPSPFAVHVEDAAVTGLELLELGSDWAVVRVLVKAAADAPAYRQTRIYEKRGEEWVRVPPTPNRWGKLRHLETGYFVFDYYARDAAAIEAAALQLDGLYTDFYAAFFHERPQPDQWRIRIDPTLAAGKLPPAISHDNPLTLPSPAATLAPQSLAEGDLLVQTVALALLQRLGDQATARYQLPRQWRPLFSGMSLWQMWDHDLSLGIWHKPLVRWALWDKESVGVPGYPSIPVFAHELCAHYRLWMELPVEVGVPISCWWQTNEHENYLSWRFPYRPAAVIPLPQLPGEVVMAQRFRRVSLIQAEEVAFATIAEYIAATYGPDQMPVLLAELREHETWATLLPALFGVSQTDFEAGWRDFLNREYGIVCCATAGVQ